MAGRTRKVVRTVKSVLCACGLGKIMTVVTWTETAGGLAQGPTMLSTICPNCGQGGIRRDMTEEQVAKARGLIKALDEKKREELRKEFENLPSSQAPKEDR